MKKIKSNISKKHFHLCLIFLFLVLTIALSSMFSWQNPGNYNSAVKDEKQDENVDTIKVLFHKTGECRNVKLEEYLEGVLPAEMPPSFHFEALKAQAVAARTYIINRRGYENEQHKDAVVCTDSTHCKAYMSDEDARHKWGCTCFPGHHPPQKEKAPG